MFRAPHFCYHRVRTEAIRRNAKIFFNDKKFVSSPIKGFPPRGIFFYGSMAETTKPTRELNTLLFLGSARNSAPSWNSSNLRSGSRVIYYAIKKLRQRTDVVHNITVIDPTTEWPPKNLDPNSEIYINEKTAFDEILGLVGKDNYIFAGLQILEKPHFFYSTGSAPPHLEALAQRVGNADCYVLVSAEYNHSIPPALSNLLDHFGGSKFAYKPSGLVTYSSGQFGGIRAAMQLRAITSELGCISVSRIAAYARVTEVFGVDGTWKGDRVDGSFDGMLNQLEWMAVAMKVQRETFGIPK